jgi:hypothetical protein
MFNSPIHIHTSLHHQLRNPIEPVCVITNKTHDGFSFFCDHSEQFSVSDTELIPLFAVQAAILCLNAAVRGAKYPPRISPQRTIFSASTEES